MIDPTAWFWPVAAAPFIGSFLTVLILRLPAGRPVLWGRSACVHCRRVLAAADLIPIASWLAAGGRCRHCRARVSPLYPAIEAGALGLSLWAAALADGPLLWASCGLGWALIALAVIDARDGLLPDALTLPLTAAGLIVADWSYPAELPDHAFAALGGFAVLAAARAGYARLRGREGLGLGDAKLFAAAGAWLSWPGLPSVVLIAAVASLAWILIRGARGPSPALDTAVAFGPGLCLGTWLVWLYGPLS